MSMSTAALTAQLPRLRALLADWHAKQPAPKPFVLSVEAVQARFAKDLVDGSILNDGAKDVVVAFRTRPPLENEAATKFAQAASEGDGEDAPAAEFCAGITLASAEPGVFVAHTPGMKWNGPTLAHKSFDADVAFGPDADNKEVYQRTVVANDLLPLVLGGGIGCVLSYGQTGAGKTHTMLGLEQRIARDLFDVADKVAQRFASAEAKSKGEEEKAVTAGDVFEFQVTFLELLGKSASDLVEPPTGVDAHGNPIRNDIAIHEDKAGNVTPRLISTPVASSAALEELITQALSHRRTSATLRNATSSRSHALLTIHVKNTLLPYGEEGRLILVDLAGSERYEDSKAHDKQRMDESRENNKSLMNLKECVRAKAKMAAEDGFVHIPWRSNKLTMLLKPIFDVESRQLSRTVVIAHVSPHIQDCVHSAGTLGYAAPFKTAPPKPRGPAPYDAADPRTWSHAQTTAWFEGAFAEEARKMRDGAGAGAVVDVGKLCPEGMQAHHFGRMQTADFVARSLQALAPSITVVEAPSSAADTWTVAELKELAAMVAGSLFYLLLSAKTRKRTAVMRTRKGVGELNDTYGAAPREEYDGGFTADEEFETKIWADKEWNTVSDAAIAKAKADGLSWVEGTVALKAARLELVEKWRAAKAEGKV